MSVWGAQGRPVAGEATEMDTEELRLRRIQEKNRRNQRKFRARQRVSPPTWSLACSPHPTLISSHTPAHITAQSDMCRSGYTQIGCRPSVSFVLVSFFKGLQIVHFTESRGRAAALPCGQCWERHFLVAQAKLEDSEAQVRELSRQVMALERAKLELEVRKTLNPRP